MAPPNNRISLYLPTPLYQALSAYQQRQKLEMASDAIVEILTQFFELGVPSQHYVTTEQLAGLERKFAHLTEQVAQLRQAIASSTPTQANKTVSVALPAHAPPAPSLQQSARVWADDSFEDVEEEPDEILYDFLKP
ncbi:MAG TPA: hypothetical protein DDZ80_05645 [Cyanobacteria bacterium UBA8803]|nr:hypothetical protein [Cyanobacteria bacterium UBA9273]HBL58020.1 hypothetical protein [Cyanobacteria bacterium UBA8803]